VFLRVHCTGNKVSPRGAARRWQFEKLLVCPWTNPQFARLTSGSYKRWNWVIGSPGQWVIWVIFHFWVTGSPGHYFDPVWDPEFFRFSKKMPKMQNVHLKWWNDKSHCQVSVVGLKSLDVSPCKELLLLPMIIKNSLAWENFFTHKSTFGVLYRTGSPGQLGLRVAGFPGHWVTKCDPVPSLVRTSGRRWLSCPAYSLCWDRQTDGRITISFNAPPLHLGH